MPNNVTKAETSRHNGAKSQGPTTPEGKQRSSRNSLKHGLDSKVVVLSNEDATAYDELLFDYMRLYLPVGAIEIDLVHEIAANRWRLRRCLRLEAAAFDQALEQAAESDENDNPDAFLLAHTMGNQGTLRLLTRYEGRLRRAYEKAGTELRRIQHERIAAQQPVLTETKPRKAEPMSYIDVYAKAVASQSAVAATNPHHRSATANQSLDQAAPPDEK